MEEMETRIGKRRNQKVTEDEVSRSWKPRQSLKFENGRVYFSKQTERKILFAFTLIMLLAGVMVKIGVL